MGVFHYFSGMVYVQIVSADVPATLNDCFSHGITLYDARSTDELTVQCKVRRKDYSTLERLLKDTGNEMSVITSKGLYWKARSLCSRPVLVIGILFLILFASFLPTRVLFIQVEGNNNIPVGQILEKASQCGIYFGSNRSKVRSERMKNALLEAMPQLQWAGINTYGCVAVITVLEREEDPKQEENRNAVTSIIAVRDGVVDSCTVEKGTALCKPGQAVVKGQKLISGYTDCGISIRAETAKGDVFALTEHKLTVCTPVSCRVQGARTVSEKKYGLKIGKNRINFYKGSGISSTTCDRIYKENYITLPGGFVLPIAIVTEQYVSYDCDDSVCDASDSLLSDFAESYLLSQIVSGEILSASESTQTGSSVRSLEGVYRCREMIGRVVKEEIVKPNEYDK